MSESDVINVRTLMEQAQVYASAWSLVGGPFDSGDQLEAAVAEKAQLQEMLEEFCSRTELRELAEQLIQWHTDKVERFEFVLGMRADTEVKLQSGDETVTLSGDRLKGFRIGMTIAREWLGKCPLSIEMSTADVEEG
ncbi:hypothetical protein WP8S17C03_23040 [Metapseudomonas otitidis]|uniref:Host nuclease inhibitor protein n=1 Tax=Metapseudomonas otitidis TaxID=319939 RepID=A0A6S5RTQ9_9GAMM|nr:host nuclease inhibitor protein [Pseudomonas otitidis]BBT16255.1 hypothetical protein WP8S17C03_23040 [Pseudomonas otitidis]